MTFRNIITNEKVKANTYAEKFAFSHNSNYELIEEPKEDKKLKNKKVGNSKDKKKTKDTEKTEIEEESEMEEEAVIEDALEEESEEEVEA